MSQYVQSKHDALTITVVEAAKRLGVSKWTIYRLIAAGKFPPAVWFGNRVQISVQLLTGSP